ncbi:ABC transporter permease [Anaeromicropila herbilytica]|nr:ABC transporter permease [Anaeromicropila herbilytica]
MKNRTKLPNIYLTILLIVMYLPIIIVIIYSFNNSEQSTIWGGYTLEWYHKLLDDWTLMEALKNSLVLGILSSLAAGIIGTIGAVGMTKVHLRSKGIMEYISTLPIMIPEIILGMVFMVFFSLLGLPFGMVTLVIAHTSFCIPYVYMMVKSRLVGMEQSYVEAARDLGASEVRAFIDITIPLILPAIISGMLLSFAMSLDDVVISIFVTGATTNTLPIKIYTQLKTGITPEINALSTLMLIVTFLIVFISNRIRKRKRY